ncbi:MAG TPA: Uma2 family endonuclease [Desulfosporosinus sp.]|nr:Uma2 family endonuclease [Desulfosporosinus sp.]
MGESAREKLFGYTYADYLQWDNGKRRELIEGVIVDMTLAPCRLHQEILMELGRQFSNYLLGKTCKVYVAPFDVRLPREDESTEETKTVVQPDLVVVCDPEKLDQRGCEGAPDLVVEILSPSTAKHDLIVKLQLYERAGVKEYWVVQPTDQTLMVFRLCNGEYGKPKVYAFPDHVPVDVLSEFTLDLSTVFYCVSDD